MLMLQEFKIAIILVLERAYEIINEPILQVRQGNIEILWILLPLLTALVLMEVYFGKYKKEELGWNSAVSNSLILFFVGMNLCSFLSSKGMLVGITSVIAPELFGVALTKTIITLIVLSESIILLILNFFHVVSKRFAFGISSALIMNYIGFISIVLVYSDLPITLITIPAILLIFITMVLFFWFLQFIEPKFEGSEEENEQDEEELEEIEEEG